MSDQKPCHTNVVSDECQHKATECSGPVFNAMKEKRIGRRTIKVRRPIVLLRPCLVNQGVGSKLKMVWLLPTPILKTSV
jgi:hypothetical protein